MNDVTLTALQQSIEKWERRAAGEHDIPLGTKACPLCALFNTVAAARTDTSCHGCPVFEKTGQVVCECTPYTKYVFERTNDNAQREVDFLKSLLPGKAKFDWVDLNYLG